MRIFEVKKNKKKYMELLFLADEQEDMIDKYINRGMMFVLDDNGVKAECVVTDEGNGILEIKNIATNPKFQRMGYGKILINFLITQYKNQFSILQVGTGESFATIGFYVKCGFSHSHVIKNFFTDNYNHFIYEDGIQLVDMIYLRKAL